MMLSKFYNGIQGVVMDDCLRVEISWLKDQMKSLQSNVDALIVKLKCEEAENEQHKRWLKSQLDVNNK